MLTGRRIAVPLSEWPKQFQDEVKDVDGRVRAMKFYWGSVIKDRGSDVVVRLDVRRRGTPDYTWPKARARAWVLPEVVRDVLPDAQHHLIKKAPTAHGWGVVAKTDIPANTFLASYPGRVYRDGPELQRAVQRGSLTDTYTLETFQVVNSKVVHDLVIIPAEEDVVLKRYASGVVLYANEPSQRTVANAAWVKNVDKERIEVWTDRDVKKGEEITLCYGPKYARKYQTSCKDARNTTMFLVNSTLYPRAARPSSARDPFIQVTAVATLPSGRTRTKTAWHWTPSRPVSNKTPKPALRKRTTPSQTAPTRTFTNEDVARAVQQMYDAERTTGHLLRARR